MKFTREALGNVNLVKSYAPGELRIGEQILRSAVCISATEIVEWAPRSIAELRIEDLAVALSWQPEIILLGTGVRQQFPSREIYGSILGRGVGFEVMDTGAACRTFNVLVGESRRVAASLLL